MNKAILALLIVLCSTRVAWTNPAYFDESEFADGEGEESSTETPDDSKKPTVIHSNTDGVCLLATIDFNITINFNNNNDESVAKSVVIPKDTLVLTESACKDGKIASTAVDGPAIQYTWAWPAAPGTKADPIPNVVLITFSQDDTQSSLTGVKAHIETTDAQFKDSDGVAVDVEVEFDLPTDLGKAYQCAMNSEDMPSEEVDEGIIELKEVHFELGSKLNETAFEEGATCGASGVHVAMFSILLGLLATNFRWLL